MKALTWERLLFAATKTEQQDSECVFLYRHIRENSIGVSSVGLESLICAIEVPASCLAHRTCTVYVYGMNK